MKSTLCPGYRLFLLLVTLFFAIEVFCLQDAAAQTRPRWKAHDPRRPRPRVVTTAPMDRQAPAPSDAVVLFDGTDLSKWRSEDEGMASWPVEDGAMAAIGKGEDIFTIQPFGDVQLHVEWAAPAPPRGKGQGRGNSGIFLMGLYEVQVLDSYQNDTYADGQAAAIYGQHPPLVNACRPPGQWQSYDIVFRRPRFLADGTLSTPARMTVFHNNVLVQDGAVFLGPTMWLQHLPYKPHLDKLPISLQDHGNPVRYRNIWVRELREWNEPGPAGYDMPPVITLTPEALARYEGRFKYSPDSESDYVIKSDGSRLHCIFGKKRARVDLVPHSTIKFSIRRTSAHVEFDLDGDGNATAITFHVAGSSFEVKRVE